ncbi:putative alcohol dehydrogenase [Stachybotrys elegans]|uniref:Alcohol dehydrogenase n=1 Tax=Stachybotrys elegans TaxID=80388 RepID=A0A8K0WQE8_9HYPO|nr:putative alcohol dehydrogenase [Stachybotrys elegans]
MQTKSQTAIVQSADPPKSGSLPLSVCTSAAIPALLTEHHVLVKVLAVALNPVDCKTPLYFQTPGQGVGSDFCGIVVECGVGATELSPGTRVCGAVFPYTVSAEEGIAYASGAFAEWVAVDARLLIRVPDYWDDIQGAALGGIGWGTVALAMSDVDALALDGLPSEPSAAEEPVLVYGGGTATGTMACQLLSLSGYLPIATASTQSAALAIKYGAVGTAVYTSEDCVETVRQLGRVPIRYAIDCITSPESVATCFSAMARTGGRYACLEELDDAWRTRRLIRVKHVKGYEGTGQSVRLSPKHACQSNPALFLLCCQWRDEVQAVLDLGLLKHHPVREIPGKWDGILSGLAMLSNGQVRGQKLVVRVG